MKTEHLIIFCTVPDSETAVHLSRTLVEEKLAACCNIVSGLRSIYFWKGEVCDDSELLLIIKSRLDVYDKLEQRIRELHPYEVPEILALPVYRGWKDYLNWVDEHVAGN
ncbi:MAG: divalent-cation tolerance protein CutA [Calditrichaeota bacterium]|nr:MAG: divalent-cation tolerance protein CutA [Calditrichota bacterium]